jgi:adenylosuccinate lyase
MEANRDIIDYETAEAREREVRHDVMSHVYAYGKQCPTAEPIIHLGATSCYVGDNTDVVILREAGKLVLKKAVAVLANLSAFAKQYKDMPCLAYTHLQPAQLTTVGKRVTLWMYELAMDVENLEYQLSRLKLLGSKGTTGTQASFVELFEGDEQKILRMEALIAEEMGFDGCVPVSGQTYSRKVDAYILGALSGIAQSAYKFSNDIRLLQSMKEVEEPFGKKQIGSSAMAYKRNPMRSERIGALARYVISLPMNSALTASTQWFERTLDDSANRRIVNAQAFMSVDAILNIYMNVAENLVVYEKVIDKHIRAELPFMATENVIMKCVKAGGDRQELHERIRVLSMEAGKTVKMEGKENNLIELIKADEMFKPVWNELDDILDAKKFIGRAPSQTVEFIENEIDPILQKHAEWLGESGDVRI